LRVSGQPELYSETLSQKKKNAKSHTKISLSKYKGFHKRWQKQTSKENNKKKRVRIH
jgi:hypothetical protein